jgi:iron complex transport system substrate-binding protein
MLKKDAEKSPLLRWSILCMLLIPLGSAASDNTLGIYGNANMDAFLNDEDVAFLQDIINGKNEPTKLADANNDGELDEKDLAQTEEIINGTEKDLTILDSAGRTVTVNMPINRVAVFNNEQIETMRSIKAKDMIAGVGSYVKDDEILSEFADYLNIGATKSPNYEEIIKLKPDVVIMYATFSMTEAESIQDHLKDLNPDIRVIRLDSYKPESYVNETRLMGYLFDKRIESEDFIKFYESWMDTIKSRVDKIPKQEKPSVYYENRKPYYSAGNGTGHQQKIDLAGGKNIFSDLSGYTDVDPEAVVNRNPDVIIRVDANFKGYDTTNTTELQNIRKEIINRAELAKVNAIKNNKTYVISNQIIGNVRHFVGIGYMAKWLYPDLFSDLDPQAIHQEYLNKFQGLDYDLSKKGVFVYPETG